MNSKFVLFHFFYIHQCTNDALLYFSSLIEKDLVWVDVIFFLHCTHETRIYNSLEYSFCNGWSVTSFEIEDKNKLQTA